MALKIVCFLMLAFAVISEPAAEAALKQDIEEALSLLKILKQRGKHDTQEEIGQETVRKSPLSEKNLQTLAVNSKEGSGPEKTKTGPLSKKDILDKLRGLKHHGPHPKPGSRKSRVHMTEMESKMKRMLQSGNELASRSINGCDDSLMTKCPDGQCIDIWWIGDDIPDCGINGVEDTDPTRTNMCNAVGGYMCTDNSGCMPPVFMCDGWVDCNNGEDENPAKCKAHQSKCELNGNLLCPQSSDKTPMCIPPEWICDDYKDCPGGEDENGCGSSGSAPVPATIKTTTTTTTPAPVSSNTAPTCSNNANGDNFCLINSVSGASMENNCLYSHNKARSFHNSGNLVWNSALEQSARAYAKKLTEIGGLQHSSGNYGENLYSWAGTMDAEKSCAEAVYSWYKEVEYPLYNSNNRRLYDYNADYQKGTGHFTQVVWKGTTSIGCGVAKTAGTWNKYYVVCQYSPAGNLISTFKQNVPVPVATYNVQSPEDLKP